MLEKQWLLECEASDSGMHRDVGKTEITYPFPAKDYGFSSRLNETILNNYRQRRAITDEFKKRLAEEVENGFISMIDILRRNRRDIKPDTLLKDWSQIKSKFLEPKVKVR